MLQGASAITGRGAPCSVLPRNTQSEVIAVLGYSSESEYTQGTVAITGKAARTRSLGLRTGGAAKVPYLKVRGRHR